jgi:cytidylate kinase
MDRVIAIDGPAGSGKSTVARGVASELGCEVLDTGAMYRAVTFAVLRAGIDPTDTAGVAKIAQTTDLVVGPPTLVDGFDATDAIRAPDVTATVSVVSANPAVRTVLVAKQRAWIATHGGGVVEGRDIGTVVAPMAPVKIYLVASDEERARRRQRDEIAAQREIELEALRSAIVTRDALDSNRAVSPLTVADDAIVIDTTDRTAAEIIADVSARYRAAVGEGS